MKKLISILVSLSVLIAIAVPSFGAEDRVIARFLDENNVPFGVGRVGNSPTTALVDGAGNTVSPQYPISADGDSVYAKDIDTVNSSIGDFSGAVVDLFSGISTSITTSVDNPTITITLLRPIDNHGFFISTPTGNFSNVTIVSKDSAGNTMETVDDSANNTKYTANEYYFQSTDKWCTLVISFTTTDDVTIGYMCIQKGVQVDATLHALKPDGTVTAIDATAGGNLKVSFEEVDPSVDPVRTDMEGGGKIAVGTTAVEATFTGTTKSIIITADNLNTGVLYIGESTVTNLGANAFTLLQAGESVTISYDDSSNAVYVVSDTAAQNFFKGALL